MVSFPVLHIEDTHCRRRAARMPSVFLRLRTISRLTSPRKPKSPSSKASEPVTASTSPGDTDSEASEAPEPGPARTTKPLPLTQTHTLRAPFVPPSHFAVLPAPPRSSLEEASNPESSRHPSPDPEAEEVMSPAMRGGQPRRRRPYIFQRLGSGEPCGSDRTSDSAADCGDVSSMPTDASIRDHERKSQCDVAYPAESITPRRTDAKDRARGVHRLSIGPFPGSMPRKSLCDPPHENGAGQTESDRDEAAQGAQDSSAELPWAQLCRCFAAGARLV